MNRVLKACRVLLLVALLGMLVQRVNGTETITDVVPYSDLCGITAVRVSVLHAGYRSPTPDDVRVATELDAYLSDQGVPIAPSISADTPLLRYIIEPPLQTEGSIIINARFLEDCSVGRLPGKVIHNCETWPLAGAVIRHGDKVDVDYALKSSARSFAMAYKSAQSGCH